jgi:hypothetical protein
MALMSQRQYVAHRGVARSAVQRAIAEGRISTMPNGEIDSEMADREWEQNTIAPNREGGKLARLRMAYLARQIKLADMRYGQLSGDLLPKAEVQVAVFNGSRRWRDAVQNVPTRCCGAIAGGIRRALEAAGLAPNVVTSVTAKLEVTSWGHPPQRAPQTQEARRGQSRAGQEPSIGPTSGIPQQTLAVCEPHRLASSAFTVW